VDRLTDDELEAVIIQTTTKLVERTLELVAAAYKLADLAYADGAADQFVELRAELTGLVEAARDAIDVGVSSPRYAAAVAPAPPRALRRVS